MKELAEKIVALLNSMVEADPTATHSLCVNRMPCSQAMADHPAVIVDELGQGSNRWVVGLMGVLNGLLVDSPWRVAMTFDANPELKSYPLLRFDVVPVNSSEVEP